MLISLLLKIYGVFVISKDLVEIISLNLFLERNLLTSNAYELRMDCELREFTFGSETCSYVKFKTSKASSFPCM
jgi:hypothetical protein